MTKPTAFVKVEETLFILQAIAKKYHQGTPEYDAIKLAAEALLFVKMKDVGEQFVEFSRTMGKELSSIEKEHLKSLGLSIEQS